MTRRNSWYKRYGADFLMGCMSLTLEEKGAYSCCLDLIYERAGPIPDDPRWLSGVLGCSVRRWKSIREKLLDEGKLSRCGAFLSNPRAEIELAAVTRSAGISAKGGAANGVKRLEKSRKSREKVVENEAEFHKNNDLIEPYARVPDAREERIDLGLSGSSELDRSNVQTHTNIIHISERVKKQSDSEPDVSNLDASSFE